MPNETIPALSRLVGIALNRGWTQRPWVKDALIGLEVETCLEENDPEAARQAMSLYEKGVPCPSKK